MEENKIANIVYNFLNKMVSFNLDSIFGKRIFACDWIVIFLITERGILYIHACRKVSFFISNQWNHVSHRFHSSSGKNGSISTLVISAWDIFIHFYIRSLRQRHYDSSVEIARFVIQVGKTDSQLNEIRVGINNKQGILTWQSFNDEKKKKIDRDKLQDELIIIDINYKYYNV